MSIKINFIKNEGGAQQEHINILVLADCDLGNYAVVDTTYSAGLTVSNKWRHSFWFPSAAVKAGDQIFLYTRMGKNQIRPYTLANKKTISLHDYYWGSNAAIWNDGGDKAAIIQYAVINRGTAS